MILTREQLKEFIKESLVIKNINNLNLNYHYLFEQNSNEITLNYQKGSIKIIKKDNSYFISSWPSHAKITGVNVENISINNLIKIEKIKNQYARIYSDILKAIEENQYGNNKKYKYEEGVGYPIILYNTKDPIVSSLFIDLMPEDYKDEIVKSIPEGHVGLICIDPRSRKGIDINFGVWSVEQGGNKECQLKNKTIFEDILNVIGGSVGVYAMGSLVTKRGNTEAQLYKSNNDAYLFKDQKDINNFLNSMGKSKNYDYVVIDNCKYINKVLAYAQTYTCSKYSLIPKTLVGDLAASLRDSIDFITGDSTSAGSKGSDNCASMGYKLAHMAKIGSFPTSIDQSLFQFPPSAIEYAKKKLK